jgi:cobalt-zinc-cadmium efflux system outer membrane protein
MYRRFFYITGLPLLFAVSLASRGQSLDEKPPLQTDDRPLTEAQSLQLGLARPALEDLAAGRIAQARSEVVATGLWPNPELEYTREQVDRQVGDSTEETLWLSQRFELSGQRGLRKDAALQRVEAVGLGNAAYRVETAADIRLRFYRVLAQRQKVTAIQDWDIRLENIGEIIQKRQSAGEVSGYDALRLTREQASVQATLHKAQAVYERLWEELIAVLGGADAVRGYQGVAGRLLPEPPTPVESLLASVAERPDIRRYLQEAGAQEQEQRAGERGWIPDLTLGVGRKSVDDDLGRDAGPVITAAITIPLFDHGQAEQQRAAAAAKIARSRYQIALAKAEGEVRGLWREVSELTRTAWQQQQQAQEAAGQLIHIAQLAYEGGEIGVLELLDAYRGAHDAELEALEMAAAARQAHITLDRLTGVVTP